MTDTTLVPPDALTEVRVALSVSDSPDLARLGLTADHLNLVAAEVARAVILAGGIITYGGRLRPEGFTQIVVGEVRRYGDGRHAVEIYVPEPEYRDISPDDLRAMDLRLGTSGSIKLVTSSGATKSIPEPRNDSAPGSSESDAQALTAMRRTVSQLSDARVAVGGKLSGFRGSEPGVIEEVRLSLESSKPVYVSGGYGGAAAAIAKKLGYDSFDWAPPDFPSGWNSSEEVSESLGRLGTFASRTVEDGLTAEERQVLAVSYRPSDIAALVVQGLARRR